MADYICRTSSFAICSAQATLLYGHYKPDTQDWTIAQLPNCWSISFGPRPRLLPPTLPYFSPLFARKYRSLAPNRSSRCRCVNSGFRWARSSARSKSRSAGWDRTNRRKVSLLVYMPPKEHLVNDGKGALWAIDSKKFSWAVAHAGGGGGVCL